MMYLSVFILTLAACLLLRGWMYWKSNTELSSHTSDFRTFQMNYLGVYLLGVTADWLQGPYVYALYTQYGFEKKAIGQLFIAGFGSSAIFGTFIASIADKYGRKQSVIWYVITYVICCATKHSPNFYVLLFGRIMAGISTSILFSAFEAWMVSEHKTRNYQPEWIGETFSKAQFLNGVAAIVSGQVAGAFASKFGKVAPFDLAIADLVVLGLIVSATWTENYGDANESVAGGFKNAVEAVKNDQKIQILGLVQSLFEGSMYIFVFLWTPALQNAQNLVRQVEIPHGMIFSTFMVAFMIGSSAFDTLVKYMRVDILMRAVLFCAVLCFITCTALSQLWMVYGALIVFEGVCGLYFPAIGTIRARYVPEETRSAIMNFYRIPLNIIVVSMLWEDLPINFMWKICTVLMMIAFALQTRMTYLCKGDVDEVVVEADLELKGVSD